MSNKTVIAGFVAFIVAILVVWKWPSSEKAPIAQAPHEVVIEEPAEVQEVVEKPPYASGIASTSPDSALPKEVDRIAELFTPYPPTLPIVETVSYVARVPWLSSRPAYLGDWASYYETSKHFISRSIKGAGIYMNESVSRGDRFNVFRKDKNIEFHLVVDLSRTRMWLYYFDKDENTRQLLKSYSVCVGKLADSRSSGSLTPTGVFEVGEEVAVYKEGDMGLYKNSPCEMVTIFGMRWIPLSREIANCSGSCKGLGLHGVPWARDPDTGALVERRECVGDYGSLGCIRLLTEDIQEIFAIIISKPSYIHIVKDFSEANLPGKAS